jgi:hypothetical protein
MSKPTPSIGAAATFLAHDTDPVDFVPAEGSRPPLLRRRNAPSEILELHGASELELHAVETGMVWVHNQVAAMQQRPGT